MKLAYLLLAHKNLPQVARLVNELQCGEVAIFIHIDKKTTTDQQILTSLLNDTSNVFFTDNRHQVTWGGFGITAAILELMQVCLQHSSYDYLSVISGQDFPIQSNAFIIDFLSRNKGTEFLEYMELPDSRWIGNNGLDRYEYYWAIEEMGLENSIKMVNVQRQLSNKRTFPGNMSPYGGSGWFTITEECAKYVLQKTTESPDLLSFFRYTYAAEEMLFPSIIMNSPYATQVTNNNLRYIDWHSGPQYPKILRQSDIDNMIHGGHLWARKFDSDVDDQVISRLANGLSLSPFRQPFLQQLSPDRYTEIKTKENTQKLVLMHCGHRTTNFEQATFINNLLYFFEPTVNILLVKTDSSEAKKVSFKKEGNIEILTIPNQENGLFLSAGDTAIQKEYAQKIVNILLPYLKGQPGITFWVNSVDYLNVCEVIRENFEGAEIMYVHHAWSWKHMTNISDEEFSLHWKKGNTKIHPEAFELNGYQQRMAELATEVITVTKQARQFMTEVMDIPSKKVHLIYNGIDTPEVPLNGKEALKAKYGFRPDEKIILFTGRVKEDTGLSYLINAFRLIASIRPNIRLLIAGDGDIPPFISMAAPYWSRVTFTGELSAMELSVLYQMADVGVLLSLFEQCSFTAIEMRFHRLPIITSGADGLDELFEDEVDALKLNLKYDSNGKRVLSKQELAEKIVRLIKDDQLVARLTENSYQKATQMFTASEMRGKYLTLLESIHATQLQVNNTIASVVLD